MALWHRVGVSETAVPVLDANLAAAKVPYGVLGGVFCGVLFAVNALRRSDAALLHRPALTVLNDIAIMLAHARPFLLAYP